MMTIASMIDNGDGNHDCWNKNTSMSGLYPKPAQQTVRKIVVLSEINIMVMGILIGVVKVVL